jgi:FdhD protein
MPTASAIFETSIHRYAAGSEEDTVDRLAVEEPLEIRLGLKEQGKYVTRPISITMRTPGFDEELAAGFLFSEGIITRTDQIASIKHTYQPIGDHRSLPIAGEAKHTPNTVVVELTPNVAIDLERLKRHFYTTSSCGVCGKASIEALRTNVQAIEGDIVVVSEVLSSLPERLRAKQEVFDSTGGLHASALFTAAGDLDILREDVGRHNALDKVIGAKFMAGETPLSDRILLVSGRASFELVQKALMAGVPILAAVGAPSSLAVELAREFGMTLVGFVRDGRFNIYTGDKIANQELSHGGR